MVRQLFSTRIADGKLGIGEGADMANEMAGAIGNRGLFGVRDVATEHYPICLQLDVPVGGSVYVQNLGPSPLLVRRNSLDDQQGLQVAVGTGMSFSNFARVYLQSAVKDQGSGPQAFGLCIFEWFRRDRATGHVRGEG